MKFTLVTIALLAVSAVHSKKQLGCGGRCGGAVVAAPVVAVATRCVTLRVPSRWTAFGPFGPCSVRCGTGVQIRRRTCIRGDACSRPCVGPDTESRPCGTPIVHSRWTAFSAFSACSVRCGKGVQTSRRTCIAGNSCGRPCTGPDVRSRTCGIPIVHSRWSGWTSFSSCSVRCGLGTQSRSRTCNRGNSCGRPCTGPAVQSRSCGTPIKPAYWTRWSAWNSCSRSCGVGTQVRTRRCVRSACSGTCTGPSRQTRSCGTVVLIAACRPAIAVAPVAVPAAPVAAYGVGGSCVDIRSRRTCRRYARAGYCGRRSVLRNCCSSCAYYKRK